MMRLGGRYKEGSETMSFIDTVGALLDLIALDVSRIRSAADRRDLKEMRRYLDDIRKACEEIGHEVTEKEVMLENVDGL